MEIYQIKNEEIGCKRKIKKILKPSTLTLFSGIVMMQMVANG